MIFNLSLNLESNWNLKITKYMAKINLFFFSLWVLFCISALILGILEIAIHQDIYWPYTWDSKFFPWLWILKVTLLKVGEKNFFWPLHLACGILVPRPGIKPVSTALEAWSLNHWTPRKFQESLLVTSFAHEKECAKLFVEFKFGHKILSVHLWLFNKMQHPSSDASGAMAPHSSTLAWKIHGQRSLVGCSPWGC